MLDTWSSPPFQFRKWAFNYAGFSGQLESEKQIRFEIFFFALRARLPLLCPTVVHVLRRTLSFSHHHFIVNITPNTEALCEYGQQRRWGRRETTNLLIQYFHSWIQHSVDQMEPRNQGLPYYDRIWRYVYTKLYRTHPRYSYFRALRSQKEAWFAKQERACAVINNRLGYNVCLAVKGPTTVAKIIAKVEIRFWPSGSAVFTALDREYNKLSLSDCNNIMDFAEKLRKAKKELLYLDTSCKIGKPHFIHRFLSSLGPSFDIFRATISQTQCLLPIKVTDGTVNTAAVTFDETVMTAEKEEQRLKQQETEATKPILISLSHPPAENQTTITVPYYTHCKKHYHLIDDCWVLHPKLKKANDKKRRATKSNKKRKRSRPSPSDAEDDTYNFGGMSLHLMAARPLSDLGNLWLLDTGCS